jgi:RHS repeat-associated protein
LGSYAYDTVGNITTSGESGTAQTYNYGVRRAQAVKTVTASGYNKKYLYDKCGNMIVRRGDTAGSQALDYDAENRLVRFSQAGTVIVEYGYAADGMRLWKRVNQDPNKLQVWIGNIYEEKEQGGTRKTLFHVFAGGQRICTFEPTSVLNGGPNPSTTHVGYYYHQDHLGSSSVLSGNTGSQLEVNVHYPFGRTQTANPQAAFKVSNQFTGQVKDEETGLYYYGARYYDPELGRFIQADTIIPDLGNPQSYNRYAYVLNNPLKYVDPDGHGPKEWFYSGVNFAGGAVVGVLSVLNPVPVQFRNDPPPSTTAEYYGRRFGENIGVSISCYVFFSDRTLSGSAVVAV